MSSNKRIRIKMWPLTRKCSLRLALLTRMVAHSGAVWMGWDAVRALRTIHAKKNCQPLKPNARIPKGTFSRERSQIPNVSRINQRSLLKVRLILMVQRTKQEHCSTRHSRTKLTSTGRRVLLHPFLNPFFCTLGFIFVLSFCTLQKKKVHFFKLVQLKKSGTRLL